jgi:HEAT repeat protein
MYTWSPLPRTLGAALRDAVHERASVRASAATDLGKLAHGENRERCVQVLIKLLEDDADDNVSAGAALALADGQAREAAAALVARTERGGERTSEMCLLALGELAVPGDAAVASLLDRSFKSGAPALRFQATIAAGAVLDVPALCGVLLTALRDPDPRVRHVACRVLDERSEREPELLSLPVRQTLVRALDDSDPATALAAVILLLRLVEPHSEAADLAVGSEQGQYTERLVRLVNRGRATLPAEDEQRAIELCAELGLDQALPGLKRRAWGWGYGLMQPSPLAFQARVALARLGDPRAKRFILAGLRSRFRHTRQLAVAAAGQARLVEARPLLEALRGNGGVDAAALTDALHQLQERSCEAAR